MVGDTYKTDVAGPRRAGMLAAHLLRRRDRISPEVALGNLQGVLGLVLKSGVPAR